LTALDHLISSNNPQGAMRFSAYLFVASWLSVLIMSACAHSPQVEEFEASIGRTAQADLISRFGYPQRIQKLPNGTEIWGYEFLSGQSRCVGYRVFFDEALNSQRWEHAPCR